MLGGRRKAHLCPCLECFGGQGPIVKEAAPLPEPLRCHSRHAHTLQHEGSGFVDQGLCLMVYLWVRTMSSKNSLGHSHASCPGPWHPMHTWIAS